MATAEVVYVGSKMPLGLTLNLDQSIHLNKDQPGSVPVTRTAPGKLAPVTLKGTGFKQGIEPPPLTLDGYVWTPIPAEFWNEWEARNGLKTDHPFGPLVDGYIICAPNMGAAERMSREREKERGHNPRLTEDDQRIKGSGVAKFTKEDA